MIILTSLIYIFLFGIVFSTAAVYLSQKLKAEPVLTRINLAGIPHIDHYFVGECTQKLSEQGFQTLGDFMIELSPSQMVYTRFFINNDRTITGALLQTGNATVSKYGMEFCTDFEGGMKIESTSSAEPSLFKYPPEKIIYKYPNCDPIWLLNFHMETIAQAAKSCPIVPQPAGMQVESEYLKDYKKDMLAQVKAHILKLDRLGQYYRFTLAGALRAVIKMMLYSYFRYNPDIVKDKEKLDVARRKRQSEFKTRYKKAGFFSIVFYVLIFNGLFSFMENPLANRAQFIFRISSIAVGILGLIIISIVGKKKSLRTGQKLSQSR